MILLLLTAAAVLCAIQVMRAARLLYVSLWLAVTSAVISIILYLLEAPQVAVIELSVGAGLVTVLFVFAFSIVGEDNLDENRVVPKWLAWILVLGFLGLLGWYILPVKASIIDFAQESLARMLWEQRFLDVLAQIILIFAGVMGLLGLLGEVKSIHVEWTPPRPASRTRAKSGSSQITGQQEERPAAGVAPAKKEEVP